MDGWIWFARGPLFAAAFLVMALGLGRHLALQAYTQFVRKGSRLRKVRWNRVAKDALSWVVPVKHLVRGTILVSSASFLFHVGGVVVPIFLADHVLLWEGFTHLDLPRIGQPLADVLTVTALACGLVLLAVRLFSKPARAMSRASDYWTLLLVLAPFATGFLAAHPRFNPFPYQGMMLAHFLSADLLLVAVPFTKLAHMALYPFDRVSDVHWQLKPGAGDEVAAALAAEVRP
jgi:nitrate reductase gamma subunit